MLKKAKDFSGRHVLVTGGAGAIGSNLSCKLAEAGARVTILDDLSSAAKWNVPVHPNVRFVEASILDEQALKRVFFDGPELVFHLAALFANQNSIERPKDDLLVNGLGTLKVLQYSKMCGVERVTYASSGCSIYGKSPVPLREDFTSLDIDTPYQITKMLGELYCNFFRNYYDMKIVRTRFFNSFGPGEIPGAYRNVIPNFIYWAMQGKPLPVMGDGTQTRDWTYVGDIVGGLLRAALSERAVGEAINLASGKETKVIDMAKLVNDLVGNEGGIRFIPMRKWDTKRRLLASIDKARSILGYEPKTDFRRGLQNTVNWFRENWENIQSSTSLPDISLDASPLAEHPKQVSPILDALRD